MGSTIDTYNAVLKERYLDSSVVEKLTYPQNTLFGMLEKSVDTGFVGKQMPVPFFTGNPQGIGGVFSTAQTNVSNTVSYEWTITAGDYYGVLHIGDKVMMASRTNTGAFLANKQVEIDGLYEQLSENLSIHLWGNGGGAIGRISAINSNDVTLEDKLSAQNFEVGMTVAASTNDGSDAAHTLVDNGDGTTVTAVNRSTGVISLTSVAAISGLAVGDYLFRQSDFAGDTTVQIMRGVQAFVTGTDAPPALWGVAAATRALDPQRFAGCRLAAADYQGKSMMERIQILAAAMTGQFKAKMWTAGFLNPMDFQVLSTLVSNQGVRPLEDENTKFGYMKIDLVTPNGRVPIYTDRHCPRGTFFGFRMADWGMASLGEMLHAQAADGLDMLRRATSTDYEIRVLSYPAVYCRSPKNQGRVSLL